MRLQLRLGCAAMALLLCAAAGFAQTGSLTPASGQNGPLWGGGNFIVPSSLPPEFGAAFQKMGGRMTGAANASVTLSGTLTDANGPRTAQITVQAPGLLRFQDGNSCVLAFDGNQFQGKNNPGGAGDQRIQESLLANFPDMVFLQLATGGGLRRIGGGFRTDDGKNPNYTGPYWRLYAFAPGPRPGLKAGQPLQQPIFIALDEQTGLLAEVRVALNAGKANQQVTQTQFQNWFQQSGQWFPGQITRLENGKQVLSFQVQQAGVSGQAAPSLFQP